MVCVCSGVRGGGARQRTARRARRFGVATRKRRRSRFERRKTDQARGAGNEAVRRVRRADRREDGARRTFCAVLESVGVARDVRRSVVK